MGRLRSLADKLHLSLLGPWAGTSPRGAARASGEGAAAAAALASPPGALPWPWSKPCMVSHGAATMPPSGVGSLAAWRTAWRSASSGNGGGGGSASSGVLVWQARRLLMLLAARERAAGPAGALPLAGPSGRASAATACGLRPPFRSSGLGSCWSGEAPLAAAPPGGWLSPAGVHGHLTASLARSVSSQAEGSGRASGERANGRSSWGTHSSDVLLIAGLAGLAGLAGYAMFKMYGLAQVVRHAERVPYSGRWQGLLPHAMEQADALAGRRYKEHYGAAVASGELLPPSHPDVLLVRRIGAAVVAAAAEGAEGKAAERLRDVQWEFHVVKASDKGSCYIQHGGKVWITEAWLDNHDRDEGIVAAALAHEVAHAVAQHTVENITLTHVSHDLAVVWGLATLFVRAPLWATAAGWGVFTALGFHFSSSCVPFLRPLHWYQEYEADAIGARIMARAGFDPASNTVMHVVRSCSQKGEPDLVSALTSTHPSDMSRAMRSAEALPETCKIYTEAGFGTCEATSDHLKEVAHRYYDALKAKLERLEQQLKEESEGEELRAASEARPHTGTRQRRLETDMELQQ